MQNFSVTTWNVQKKINFTGFTSLRKIKSHLSEISSEIIILQEMCDAEKAFKKMPFLKSYNSYIPPINKAKEDGVLGYNYNIILSKYPLVKVGEVAFPKWDKKINLQNCTRADIQHDGKVLRIYNCHFIIFGAGPEIRLKQLEHILSDAKDHPGPVIIGGDLNPTIPKIGWDRKIISLFHEEPKREMFIKGKFMDYDERDLFNKTIKKHGFKEVLNLHVPTWSPFKSKIWEPFKLKLDWFLIKGVKINKVHLDDYVSDHRSIKVVCRV